MTSPALLNLKRFNDSDALNILFNSDDEGSDLVDGCVLARVPRLVLTKVSQSDVGKEVKRASDWKVKISPRSDEINQLATDCVAEAEAESRQRRGTHRPVF